jgi:ribose 5-phosphate isomerase B
MKIAIGTDHAGYRYKELLKVALAQRGHQVVDFGTNSEEMVDYPVFIRPVALAVARGDAERGIVLGGSGNGEQIAANKVKGIRAALAWDEETARLARLHNNAQVVSIGARVTGPEVATRIVDAFLSTHFSAEPRHARRLEMVTRYEQNGELPPIPASEG